MSDPIQKVTDTSFETDGPVVLVNIFTPANGDLQAFIDVQINEYKALKGHVAGWIGNTLCRSIDGAKAINIAVFENREKYHEWRYSDRFREHMEVIKPLIVKAEPYIVQTLYGDSKNNPLEGVLITA
jgi:heme-degrading monooxygenase HmoA